MEGLLSERLRQQGREAEGSLGKDLLIIKRLLDDSTARRNCGWGDLEYHLAHRIRLIHGLTHPENATASSGPLRPEFALSVIDDVAELLRIWGYST